MPRIPKTPAVSPASSSRPTPVRRALSSRTKTPGRSANRGSWACRLSTIWAEPPSRDPATTYPAPSTTPSPSATLRTTATAAVYALRSAAPRDELKGARASTLDCSTMTGWSTRSPRTERRAIRSNSISWRPCSAGRPSAISASTPPIGWPLPAACGRIGSALRPTTGARRMATSPAGASSRRSALPSGRRTRSARPACLRSIVPPSARPPPRSSPTGPADRAASTSRLIRSARGASRWAPAGCYRMRGCHSISPSTGFRWMI